MKIKNIKIPIIGIIVVLGIIVLSAATFAVINLLVDASYRLIDPRQRRSGGTT